MGAVYTQLSFQERRRIEDWRLAKVPVAGMARVLKRRKSTIFRGVAIGLQPFIGKFLCALPSCAAESGICPVQSGRTAGCSSPKAANGQR
ncbi:helix-turn-helix domain-containing protein (plasmid) [Leisingera sp. M527]|uniref:helix-turn-helix domain-containing protein n=1 Tax=Leisingera sp. M527 TaxID=2867014 RepID=UPI0022089939|nr:helix-turn-helix domain-containing protein [Leisingera sp. M527]